VNIPADDNEIPRIVVKRFSYEEPYYTQVEIAAWNGSYGGKLDIYCEVDDLNKI